MSTARWFTLLMGAAAAACHPAPETPPAPPGPDVATPVSIVGSRGAIGRAEVRYEPRVVARTVPVHVDSLWRVLPIAYEMLAIPDARGDSSQYAFGNPEFRPRRLGGERLSRFIECGSGLTAVPRADDYDVTMRVLTRLTAAPDGGTTITTTVDATARPRAEAGNPVHCPSTGLLETRILALALRELAGQR